mgnify:CR=1 FL=1
MKLSLLSKKETIQAIVFFAVVFICLIALHLSGAKLD